MKGYINILIVFCLLASSCKESYDVVLPPTQTSYLVVEGLINLNGETKVNLSRTTLLHERNMVFENDAAVRIEGEDNSTYTLSGQDSGRYVTSALTLNENIRYRLYIKTHDNREYVSDFMQPVKTPEIDDITWTRYNQGIEIYVNSQDNNNNTQYYRWEYEETWEFKTPYAKEVDTIIVIAPYGRRVVNVFEAEEELNANERVCWKSQNSTSILIGNTTKLRENKVYIPLVYYPYNSSQFDRLYSIKVKQYGLTKGGYEFFYKIKKNTESLGSIFDALPSEIVGNIHCLTDTLEKTVGYIDVTRMTEKRIFISNGELGDWKSPNECLAEPISLEPDILTQYLFNGAYEPLYFSESLLDSSVVWIAPPVCVYCTLRGTNVKPSFWP